MDVNLKWTKLPSHTFTHLLFPAGWLGLLLSVLDSCSCFLGVGALVGVSFWLFGRLWLSVSGWLLLWLTKLKVRNMLRFTAYLTDPTEIYWDFSCFNPIWWLVAWSHRTSIECHSNVDVAAKLTCFTWLWPSKSIHTSSNGHLHHFGEIDMKN